MPMKLSDQLVGFVHELQVENGRRCVRLSELRAHVGWHVLEHASSTKGRVKLWPRLEKVGGFVEAVPVETSPPARRFEARVASEQHS